MKANAAVAACPEGNDQPCARTSQMARGGRGRAVTSLATCTPSASPAHPTAAATAAGARRRRVAASVTTAPATTSSTTHEPSHVTIVIAVFSVGVRELTTSRVTP